jgi:hypothetical protein
MAFQFLDLKISLHTFEGVQDLEDAAVCNQDMGDRCQNLKEKVLDWATEPLKTSK